MKFTNKFIERLINEVSACMYIEHNIDLNHILHEPGEMISTYPCPDAWRLMDTYINFPKNKARMSILHTTPTHHEYESAVLTDSAKSMREPGPIDKIYDIKIGVKNAFYCANIQCIPEDMDMYIINLKDNIYTRRWCGSKGMRQFEKKIDTAIMDPAHRRHYVITMNSVKKETVI